jgi:hypothetical protein
MYRKLRATGHDGTTFYGSAFAGSGCDFTKAMTLIVNYGSEKLVVSVPVAELAVENVVSLELSCTLQASYETARPAAAEPVAMKIDPQEDRLWSATETFIRAQPIQAKAELTKLRRAVTLIYHPDQYADAEKEIRSRILARANDLIDRIGEQIAA